MIPTPPCGSSALPFALVTLTQMSTVPPAMTAVVGLGSVEMRTLSGQAASWASTEAGPVARARRVPSAATQAAAAVLLMDGCRRVWGAMIVRAPVRGVHTFNKS